MLNGKGWWYAFWSFDFWSDFQKVGFQDPRLFLEGFETHCPQTVSVLIVFVSSCTVSNKRNLRHCGDMCMCMYMALSGCICENAVEPTTGCVSKQGRGGEDTKRRGRKRDRMKHIFHAWGESDDNFIKGNWGERWCSDNASVVFKKVVKYEPTLSQISLGMDHLHQFLNYFCNFWETSFGYAPMVHYWPRVMSSSMSMLWCPHYAQPHC